MSNLLVLPRQLAMASGAFAPNTLYFYEPGTSTPKAVYDVDGDSLGTSVAADANGRYPAMYGDGLYKVVEQTSAGVTVWTADNVGGFETGQGNGTLRSDLASTDSGKGASLVGVTQGGSVQDAVDWVTPEMWEDLVVDSNDWRPAIQAAVDYVGNAATTVKKMRLNAREYPIKGPILLYQKDGLIVEGAGRFASRIVIMGNFSSFSYPAEWQALAEYADLQTNPAVFQIARRRVSGVGSPGDYDAAGAVGGAWNLDFDGFGIFGRGTYEKLIHGFYGKDVGNSRFSNIHCEGVHTGAYFPTFYASDFSNFRVFYSVKPVRFEAGTSVGIRNVAGTWCDEGHTIYLNYSDVSNIGCDHWGVGSYAYDVKGQGLQLSGMGAEKGFGGLLKIRDSASRSGIHISGCSLVGGVSEGELNDTGQTAIGDFGVAAMIDIEGAHVTFDAHVIRADIYRSAAFTHFGARLWNKTKVVFGVPADPANYADRPRILFNQYVSTVGSLANGWPSVLFLSDQDKEWGSAYLSATQTIGSNVTYYVPFDTVRDGNIHSRFSTSTGEWTCKVGGVYRFRFDGVLTGDAYNGYVGIQVTNRPAGYATITPTHIPALATTNTERQACQEQVYRLVPGDTVRIVVRHLTSANAASILANAQFCWEQIA